MKVFATGVRKLDSPVSMKNPAIVGELLGDPRQAEVEIPAVIHIGKDMMAREVEVCAIGSMMSVTVEARTIFAHAVNSGQEHSIIIVHNHAFQKDPEPSLGDRDFLHGIKMASSAIGIPIHDSVILGTKGHYSFMEHGVLFEKSTSYRPLPYENGEKITARMSMPDTDHQITNHRKAMELVSFIRKETKPVTAVIHMTPDMEPTLIEVYDYDPKHNPREEARHILRRAITNPSTKYLVLISNLGLFESNGKAEEEVMLRLKYTRLGAMVLCVPVVDMIMIEQKGHRSFSEEGKVFPKCRNYAMVEDEGMKLKGPARTKRSDLPPYPWTFR